MKETKPVMKLNKAITNAVFIISISVSFLFLFFIYTK